MGSATGARKVAARRIGVSLAEYNARTSAGQKWCGSCRRWHPRKAFGVDRSRSDGLTTRCLGSRIVAIDGPGVRERKLAAAKGLVWCGDCRAWLPTDEILSAGKCREHVQEYARAWYARNAGPVSRRNSARKRGLEQVPEWWRTQLIEAFGGLCAYGCERQAVALDHIWPVARNGRSCPPNLVPACGLCNSRKKHYDPAPWVERGVKAFPDQWIEIISLALVDTAEHLWLEAS